MSDKENHRDEEDAEELLREVQKTVRLNNIVTTMDEDNLALAKKQKIDHDERNTPEGIFKPSDLIVDAAAAQAIAEAKEAIQASIAAAEAASEAAMKAAPKLDEVPLDPS